MWTSVLKIYIPHQGFLSGRANANLIYLLFLLSSCRGGHLSMPACFLQIQCLFLKWFVSLSILNVVLPVTSCTSQS